MRTPNKQLSRLNPQEVLEKIRNDQALTLQEAAIGFDIPYCTIRSLPGLPFIGGRIFPSDFVKWRRQATGLEAKPEVAMKRGKEPKEAK